MYFHSQATSQLVNGIKGDAEGQDDDDAQKRLLAAAKVLADATAKLVEAAKVCFSHQAKIRQTRLTEIQLIDKNFSFEIVL